MKENAMSKNLCTSVLISIIFMAGLSSAHAQTSLFKSPPDTSTFEAVFQNDSPSSPKIGTLPTTGKGTTISIGTFPGIKSPSTALIDDATTVGHTAQLGIAVYDTAGTTGTESNNPLALGTSSATPNVFKLGTGQTLTYSVDFHNNYHGIDVISLFNPKAPDAGTTDPTTPTTGGYLGIALTLSTNAKDAAVSLQGQNSFAANNLASVSETNPVTPNATNAWRLVLILTNNGNGTDTVSGSIYSLDLIGGAETETLSTTLSPETVTLGTTAGDYDLDNSALGIELGVKEIANLNNKFYMTNISVTSTGAAP